ncbi:DUF4172 domain-containing protein [Acetobacter malorum]
MAQYIHQFRDCPDFRWDMGTISHEQTAMRHRQGRVLGSELIL